jgi:serine/threonine-protein kinase RsbW
MNATVARGTCEKVFRRSFPPQPSSARRLRDALERYFAATGLAGRDAARLLLCADEALVNAVAHAPQTPVLVAAWVRDERVVLEVSDEGPGFDVGQAGRCELPDLNAEHGRGLYIIHHFMDRVRIDSCGSGTVVRMELQLLPVESPLAPTSGALQVETHCEAPGGGGYPRQSRGAGRRREPVEQRRYLSEPWSDCRAGP